jgi:hypothetical protein
MPASFLSKLNSGLDGLNDLSVVPAPVGSTMRVWAKELQKHSAGGKYN